jgi:O-antigen biosynthesis protein
MNTHAKTKKHSEHGADGLPLVSCIMPTRNRGELARQAIRMFLAQTYPNRELIVVDDGEEDLGEIGSDQGIKLERLSKAHALGAKRNIACELARGDLVAHWDDDDWYAPDRLARQVEAMIDGADACGSGSLYHLDTRTNRWFVYTYRGTRPWVAGTTLMYRRQCWLGGGFEPVSSNEDFRFLLGLERVVDLRRPELCVVRLHDKNTSSRIGFGPDWRALDRPPPEILALVA